MEQHLTELEISLVAGLVDLWPAITGLDIEDEFLNPVTMSDVDELFGDLAYRLDVELGLGLISQPLHYAGNQFLSIVVGGVFESTLTWKTDGELPVWAIRNAITISEVDNIPLKIVDPESNSVKHYTVLVGLQKRRPDERVVAKWAGKGALVIG